MSCDGDEVTVSFHPVTAPEVRDEMLSSALSNSNNPQYDEDKISPMEPVRGPSLGLDMISMNWILILERSYSDFLFQLI